MRKDSKSICLPFDFHSHILPNMDDGAENVEISLAQLKSLATQGIRHVVATPHLYLHRTELSAFAARRRECAAALQQAVRAAGVPLPGISLGAEVYLERGLLQIDLTDLRMADTDYVLFELPHNGADENDIELIFNLCTRNGVRPLIAHLDRYFSILSDSVLEMIFSLNDVVIQMNNDFCLDRRRARRVLQLLRDDVPIVFGSDTHNMTDRCPNFASVNKFLASKLDADTLKRIKQRQLAFLLGKLSSHNSLL